MFLRIKFDHAENCKSVGAELSRPFYFDRHFLGVENSCLYLPLERCIVINNGGPLMTGGNYVRTHL
jgi:hypothetical protein